jgi:hypothetical protein
MIVGPKLWDVMLFRVLRKSRTSLVCVLTWLTSKILPPYILFDTEDSAYFGYAIWTVLIMRQNIKWKMRLFWSFLVCVAARLCIQQCCIL